MLAVLLSLSLSMANNDPCAYPEARTKLIEPLPSNGVVFYDLDGPWWPIPAAVLFDASGEEVPTTVVEHDTYYELVPDTLLPEGEYVVQFGEQAEAFFTVVDVEDLEAPPPPVFASVDRHSSGSVKTTEVVFERLPQDQFLEVEMSASGDFRVDATRVLFQSSAGSFGRGLCSTIPSDYDHKERYVLRARTVDHAGNASDWVVREPNPRILGCSTAAAPSGSLGWFLGWLLLGARRR